MFVNSGRRVWELVKNTCLQEFTFVYNDDREWAKITKLSFTKSKTNENSNYRGTAYLYIICKSRFRLFAVVQFHQEPTIENINLIKITIM